MKRLLCIDAQRAELSRVKDAVERAGYEVLTAETGRQGLEMFTSEQVDGVLLNPGLPDADGAQFERELARLKPDVPLLLFAGSVDAVPWRFLDAYLQHPDAPDVLMARVAGAGRW